MQSQWIMLVVGVLSAATQLVLLREYLVVFQGNELVLGLILAGWLTAGGFGSLTGVRAPRLARHTLTVPVTAIAPLFGLLLVRLSRLPFAPGEVIPPMSTVAIILLSAGPTSFWFGYLFAALPRSTGDTGLYAYENAGNVAGSAVVYGCVLASAPNGIMLAVALFPLAFLVTHNRWAWFLIVALAAALPALESNTRDLRYATSPDRVVFSREGEAAILADGADTTVLLNATVYRSSLNEKAIEQAVHVPMSQRTHAERALVLFDKGHRTQLRKYQGLAIKTLALDRALATDSAVVRPPESLSPDSLFDIILLGAGVPSTARANRFFTQSFLERMRALLRTGGVFSYTLPFSPNYLGAAEQELFDVLSATLRRVFPHVWVFPGEGYTFVASTASLPGVVEPRVSTAYLGPYTMPSVTRERVKDASRPPPLGTPINTRDRPVALALALRTWAQRHGFSLKLLTALLVTLLGVAVILLPKRAAVLSIGTSGCAAGVASVGYLLLYQSVHGALYSRVAVLMMALTAGFAAGSPLVYYAAPRLSVRALWAVRRNIDLVIGVYVVLSLGGLARMPFPPTILFVAGVFVLGLLCAVQFVLEHQEHEGLRYAADLLGGVFGMALGSTVLIPLFGVTMTVLMMGAIKAMAGFVRLGGALPVSGTREAG